MNAAIDGLALVLAPTNLLALIAVGLIAGREGARTGQLLVIPFAIGFAVGALLIAATLRDPPAALAQLAVAAVAGIFLAAAYEPPSLIVGLLVFAGGAALAMNTPPQSITLSGAAATQLATGIGAVAAFCVAGLIAAAARKPWHHIALRVAGSWIAASAILVLALRLARH